MTTTSLTSALGFAHTRFALDIMTVMTSTYLKDYKSFIITDSSNL